MYGFEKLIIIGNNGGYIIKYSPRVLHINYDILFNVYNTKSQLNVITVFTFTL